MFLIRVTHSSGMLEGKYTAETVFPPNDHRNHRPRSWLLNGVKKIDRLRFLESSERTLGQAALQWLLADDRVASTLPNIYEEAQLIEFAKAPECPPLTSDELARIAELYADNFGVEREEPKFKGTMELPEPPKRRYPNPIHPLPRVRRRTSTLSRFGPFPLASRLRLFVDFLQNQRDHRRGALSAVRGGADIAFVKRGESVLRMLRRNESGEPCRRAFLVLRTPLRGPRFPRDLDIIETCLVRRAGAAVHHIDHAGAQLPHCLQRSIERLFRRT